MKNVIVMMCLTALFFSCARKVQPEPGNPNCRIISFNDSTGKPIYYVNFETIHFITETYTLDSSGNKVNLSRHYNNSIADRIDSIIYTNNDKTLYSYNESGLISKIIKYTGKIDDKYSYTETQQFEYDFDNNLITKTSQLVGSNNVGIPVVINYSDYVKGRPQKIEYKSIKTSKRYFKYEYDDYGNVLKEHLVSSTDEILQTNEFTYDYNREISDLLKIWKQLNLCPDYVNFCPDPNIFTSNAPKHLCLTSKHLNPEKAYQSQYTTNIYEQIKSYSFYSGFKYNDLGYPTYLINTKYFFTYECQ